ncbi:3D domain-containing protein [Sporosarcina sp. CAU 1771]
MFNLKIILVATILVFSAYSVTYASPFTAGDETYLSQEAKIIMEESMELEVPFQEALDVATTVVYPHKEIKPDIYTVIKGDNLSRIARAHEISLNALVYWNELTTDLIHPGDELIVSGNEDTIEIVHLKENRTLAVNNKKTSTKQGNVNSSKPKAAETTVKPKAAIPESTASVGKEMTVTATAYTAYCKGCSGTTAYGIDLRSNPNQKVVAVDPRVIPLGTKVWVEGYGEAIAGDTGGAIKGNKIDVFIPSYESAMKWGRKQVRIKVLN